MPDDSVSASQGDLPGLLREMEAVVARRGDGSVSSQAAAVRAVLDRVEQTTPGGAPLHAQIDTVRKWLAALDRPDDYARFGGEDHLRGYVATQLRLTARALEDYRRAMQ